MQIVIDLPDKDYQVTLAKIMLVTYGKCKITELPKGKWIPILEKDGTQEMEEFYGKMYGCSVCNTMNFNYNYCPECGAKMEVEDDSSSKSP